MAVANGFSFRIPARLEHARIFPLQLWITYPILWIGPRSSGAIGICGLLIASELGSTMPVARLVPCVYWTVLYYLAVLLLAVVARPFARRKPTSCLQRARRPRGERREFGGSAPVSLYLYSISSARLTREWITRVHSLKEED